MKHNMIIGTQLNEIAKNCENVKINQNLKNKKIKNKQITLPLVCVFQAYRYIRATMFYLPSLLLATMLYLPSLPQGAKKGDITLCQRAEEQRREITLCQGAEEQRREITLCQGAEQRREI